MITLQGTLALGDFRRTEYFLWYRRGWSWVFSLACLLLVSSFAVVGYLQERDSGQRLTYIPFAIFFLLWISCAIAIPLHAAKRTFAGQQWLGDPFTVTFGPDGIRTVSAILSSEVHWSVIREVCETKSLFLLCHGQRSALIIPKRLFASAEEIEAWKALVQTQIECRRIAVRGMAARWC